MTFTSSSMTNSEVYLIKNKTKQFRHKNICNQTEKVINIKFRIVVTSGYLCLPPKWGAEGESERRERNIDR